jgi:hypothetical protein
VTVEPGYSLPSVIDIQGSPFVDYILHLKSKRPQTRCPGASKGNLINKINEVYKCTGDVWRR